MRNNSSFIYAIFLVIGDFIALLSAFSLAYILRVKLDPRPLIEQIPALNYFWAFVYVLPLWILIHAFIGLYSPGVYERRFKEMGRLIVGSFLGILVVIGYNFISDGQLIPARLVPVYGLVLGFIMLLLFRTIARMLRHTLYKLNIGISDVLVIGSTISADNLIANINNTKSTGFKVVGLVGKKISGIKHYANFEDAVKSAQFHAIIQTDLYADQLKNTQILNYAQQNHISYRFLPGNTDLFIGNIAVELFAGQPIIAVHQTALIGWGRIVKRIFDMIVSTILLIIFSPLLLVIVFLQLFTGGSVFFRQTRLTRFNHTFKVYKFRTIRAEYNGLTPEEAFSKMGKPELAKKYRENGDQLISDPRFGKFGKLLRKTSLDELPQLFNVLRGDISLVGPRALVPDELNKYEKKHAVLSVKSGITGLAQVSGRGSIGFDERRKLDIYYVQNWSFWLDIIILLKTAGVVLSGEGARE